MTREEIIEQLKNAIEIIKQNGKDWLDDRDIPILEACIESLEQTQWIPASEERLPNNLESILITIQVNPKVKIVQRGYYSDNFYHIDNGDKRYKNDPDVVAWVPLPEPYKQKEGDLDA